MVKYVHQAGGPADNQTNRKGSVVGGESVVGAFTFG